MILYENTSANYKILDQTYFRKSLLQAQPGNPEHRNPSEQVLPDVAPKQNKRTLVFDGECGKVRLQPNLMKTMHEKQTSF